MAKLTLSFKGRGLKVFTLDDGDHLIGRDPQCSIVIDNLAVQPQHARLHCTDSGCRVEPVDAQYAMTLNGKALESATDLSEGDTLHIGKHDLSFSARHPASDRQPVLVRLPVVGWLQIQSGAHLGRTIRLDKAFTRIGKPEGELAIIARRDDGYYVSALQGEAAARINDEDIGDTSRKLANADRLTVGELQAQFFADMQTLNGDTTMTHAGESNEQRKFSRIPFDVTATLSDATGRWETALMDISLHGALIRKPQDFDAALHQPFALAVHLEGGPDICMDVEIAHQEDGVVGLNCRDIDVDSITHLRRLVELNLGDAELLERELSALG